MIARIWHTRLRGLLWAAALLSASSIQASLMVAKAAPNAFEQAPAGVMEGTVIYHTDAERPWRYARYYVKGRAGGPLAEAVIALEAATIAAEVPPNATTVDVDQKNFQFIPETVAIRAGDSVRFLNHDQELHNVKAVHPIHSFNVNLPSGGKHIETFKRAGGIGRPYQIGCVYHSSMRAWIYVFDHPFFQVTPADGRFRWENVPPGEYRLRMVHPAGDLRWSKMVRVEAGKTTTMDVTVSPDDLPKPRAK